MPSHRPLFSSSQAADLTPVSNADSVFFFTPRGNESEDEEVKRENSDYNISWRDEHIPSNDKERNKYIIKLSQSPEYPERRTNRSHSASPPLSNEFHAKLDIRNIKKQSIESSPISSSRSKFSQAVEDLEEVNPQRTIYERLEIPRTSSVKTEKAFDIEPETAGFKQDSHLMFSDSEIKEAFEAFDINGDQQIDGEEIRLMMEAIGEIVSDEEIEEMIRMLDFSGKGKVCYEEFFKMATGQSMGSVGAALPPIPSMVMSESSFKGKFRKSKSIRSIDSGNSKAVDASRLDMRKTPSIREDLQSRGSFDMPASRSRKSSVERPNRTNEFERAPSRMLEEPTVKVRNLRDEMRGVRPKKRRPDREVLPINEEQRSHNTSKSDIKVLDVSHSGKASSTKKDFSLTSNSSSIKLEGSAEINLLVADLVQSTFFAPKTVEKLIKMFVEVTGHEQGEMNYNQFLDVVNSRLPDDRKLEDDRVTRRIFALLDKDSNNSLSIREFSLGISYLTRPNSDEQFKLVFRVFDADDDGYITRNELTKILKLNTASIKSDDQANKKADEILSLAGGVDSMTLEGFLQVKDKRFMLLYPVQERARKIARLLS